MKELKYKSENGIAEPQSLSDLQENNKKLKELIIINNMMLKQENNKKLKELIIINNMMLKQEKIRNIIRWLWFIIFLMLLFYMKYFDVFNNTIRAFSSC